MKAIKIERDGTVTEEIGGEDFWMSEDIEWAEGDYPGHSDHAVYYDDNAMSDPGMVRATIAGHEYPLPVWIVGVEGENTVDARLPLDKVKADIALPA